MNEAAARPSTDGRPHLLVVGGGQAAKWLLFGLAERLARGDLRLARLRITVFERGWEFGTGFAWSRQYALPEHQTSLAEPISRIAFGDDQSRQFHRTATLLRQQGVVVDLRRGLEVRSLRRERGALHATTSGGETVRADAAVLATGHWRPADPLEGAPGYHPSPWPAGRLQTSVCARWLEEGARTPKRVLVLGTYLNALDAIITLSHRAGEFAEDPSGRLRFHGPSGLRLVMASRGGSLPRVWGRAPSLRPPLAMTADALRAAMDDDGFLPLSACVDLLAREIALERGAPCALRLPGAQGRRAHRRTGSTTRALRRRLAADLQAASAHAQYPSRYADTREVPWQVALFSTLPVLSESTHALSAEDQHDFDKRLRTSFFHHAMPMTLESARKVEALFASGHLQTIALGERYACVPNAQGVVLDCRARNGRQERQEFTDVVRAHAGPADIRHHPAPLFQDALLSGLVRPATRAFRDAGLAERIAADKGAEAIVERDRAPALVVGGVEIDPSTREVVGAGGGADAPGEAPVFAMGPLLIGQFLDAHSIGQLIRDSACILERLASMQGSDGS